MKEGHNSVLMQVMFSNINLIFQALATVEMDLLHVVFRVISIHTTTQYESQGMIISTHPVFLQMKEKILSNISRYSLLRHLVLQHWQWAYVENHSNKSYPYTYVGHWL